VFPVLRLPTGIKYLISDQSTPQAIGSSGFSSEKTKTPHKTGQKTKENLISNEVQSFRVPTMLAIVPPEKKRNEAGETPALPVFSREGATMERGRPARFVRLFCR
jgi:hypothetical protein